MNNLEKIRTLIEEAVSISEQDPSIKGVIFVDIEDDKVIYPSTFIKAYTRTDVASSIYRSLLTFLNVSEAKAFLQAMVKSIEE